MNAHSHTMDFGDAIKGLKAGKAKVAREGWNGKGMFLALIDPYLNKHYSITEKDDIDGTLLSYIALKTVQNGLIPWQPSQADMLADDWVFLY